MDENFVLAVDVLAGLSGCADVLTVDSFQSLLHYASDTI
jgi:hypothetical protein